MQCQVACHSLLLSDGASFFLFFCVAFFASLRWLLALVLLLMLLSSLLSLFNSFRFPLASVAQGRFALHVASKALEYYAETVFKVPYPLQKSDLLAIPGEAAILRCCILVGKLSLCML